MYIEILAKIYKDSISHHELLTQYQHINETYNGHMNLLLILFGVGLTLIVAVLPYLAYKRIDKDFNEQEKKYRNEIAKLKQELKEEFEKLTQEKINKVVKNLNEVNIKNIGKMSDEIICHRSGDRGMLFASIGQYEDSLKFYIESVHYAVKSNNYEMIRAITHNISIGEKYKNLDANKVSPHKYKNLNQYFQLIEQHIENNGPIRIKFEEFKFAVSKTLKK